MKRISILCLLLITVSCGRTHHKAGLPDVATMTSASTNDARLQGVALTFNKSFLNNEVDVREVIGSDYCNLSLGNTNPNEVSPDKVLISSTNGGRSGQIRFGHLSYYNPSGNDVVCRLFSNELFNFTFDGKTLTLKQVAPGKAWDGSTSIFTR